MAGEVTGVKEYQQLLNVRRMKKVGSRTVNELVKKGRTLASKSIRKKYTVKAQRVKKEIKVKKAKPQGSKASLVARGEFIGLINFSPRQGKRGVTVKVRKDKKRGIARRKGIKAFIETANSGRNVFVRRGKASLPIDRMIGPSVPFMYKRFGERAVRLSVVLNRRGIYERNLKKEYGDAVKSGGK